MISHRVSSEGAEGRQTPLSSYALAMRFPVLTSHMLLQTIAYATIACGLAMRCPVVTERMMSVAYLGTCSRNSCYNRCSTRLSR
eukprot:1053861-Rhodomonas_salina.1